MNAVVVDASAIAAVLFDEPEAEPVHASVRGRLIAPGLVRYELASVCLTKLLRYPERADDIEARHSLLDKLDLALFEPDWAGLPRIARRWALSVYDASYLQLALAKRAPLVTLDARLAAAYDRAVGS
jgi:predicted nucleic acid-binding protein